MSDALFRRNIAVFADRVLGPEARSELLARVARERLALAQASGAAPRDFVRYVDGVEGRPEDQVRHDGVILYRFRFLANAAAFALAYLVGRSPSGSGNFKRGFYVAPGVTEDGDNARSLTMEQFRPDLIGPNVRSITIGNVVPYNRLVDVQMAGGQRVRFSVPADLYADAAREVQRRYPGIRARRDYTRTFPDQYILKTGPRRGKPVHSPVLIMSFGG